MRNVSLFTPALLDEINRVVVRAGHRLQGLTPGQALQAQCDSTALWLVRQQWGCEGFLMGDPAPESGAGRRLVQDPPA